jgi:hypothetical protein
MTTNPEIWERRLFLSNLARVAVALGMTLFLGCGRESAPVTLPLKPGRLPPSPDKKPPGR